ncbi:MAG: hypothetical protein WCD38_03535 [Candidatus Tumulicola sp.]
MLASRLLMLMLLVAPLTACTPSTTGGGFNPPAGPLFRTHARLGVPSGRRASWLKPNAQRETLLYVTEGGGVGIYSNPSGDNFQLVGELFGFQLPSGACVDPHGNVFITDQTAKDIVEYAHGAITPKAVIADSYGEPYTCSIDRKTGRIAVLNFADPNGNYPGNVLVYPSPIGTPTEYTASQLYIPLFSAFNSKGDLYLNAYDSSYHATLAKLPNGAPSFTILTLSGGTVNIPGGVAFDGSQLLAGDSYNPKTHIYQVTVHGSTATIAGTISLSQTNTLGVYTIFISGSTTAIIAPDPDGNNVKIYSYPSGSPIGSLPGSITSPFAAVISQGAPAQ